MFAEKSCNLQSTKHISNSHLLVHLKKLKKLTNKIQIKNPDGEGNSKQRKSKCQNEPINNKLQNGPWGGKKKQKKRKDINPIGENISQNLQRF